MADVKIVDIMDREVNLADLPQKVKQGFRRYYYEMPDGVKMDIAIQVKEIFPEFSPMSTRDGNQREIKDIANHNCELLKVFNDEFAHVRFMLPLQWFNQLRELIFQDVSTTANIAYGINKIAKLYNEVLSDNNQRRNIAVLQFMANFFKAWIIQKMNGFYFYCKVYKQPEYFRLLAGELDICDIVDEYLNQSDSAIIKISLERLFWESLHEEPSEKSNENIFVVLDLLKAVGIKPDKKYMQNRSEDFERMFECTEVSVMTESTISHNKGEVMIFGSHEFGDTPIEQVRSELLALDRNTIAEYFGEDPVDAHIAFDISDQVKMVLQQEFSPILCAVGVKRGDEYDMETLLTHESKTYLLFRKKGDDSVTYGITIRPTENGTRELISLSNESEFTYKLVGDEEIGLPE